MQRLLPAAFAFGLLSLLPVTALAQTVFFSVGSEIRQHVLGGSGTSLVHTSPVPVGDLALCADDTVPGVIGSSPPHLGQYLYFVSRRQPAEPDRISRLDINTPLGKKATVNTSVEDVYVVPTAHGKVGELRLTPSCEVIYAAEGGVFQVGSATPLAMTTAGSGLAAAFNGSLWYSDDDEIGTTGSGATKSATAAVIGLGVVNGGQGSVAWNVAASSPTAPLSTGAVCASIGNAIRCGSKTSGILTTPALATFTAAGLKTQYFEFLTNDVVIAATSVDPNASLGGGAKYNGILYAVTPGASPSITEIFRAPKVSGSFPPIVGVAVGASESQAALTSGTTHEVNFGPVSFEVLTPLSCDLSIRLRQLGWSQASSRLDSINNGNSYALDPGLGGESWIDDVVVTEASGGGSCGLSSSAAAPVRLGQFTDNQTNKGFLHCHDTACEVITEGVFPFSAPDDPITSGQVDDFSDLLSAIVVSDASGITFLPSLSDAAIVHGGTIDQAEIDAATTHNAGGLALRFRICANPQCTTFAPAEQANPPISGAGLSITRLSDSGVALADCAVNDNGGANPDQPVFRTASDGVNHVFNLDTPPLGDPSACGLSTLAPGTRALFSATVFSLSGRFTMTTVLFWLRK